MSPFRPVQIKIIIPNARWVSVSGRRFPGDRRGVRVLVSEVTDNEDRLADS
jgi:hypothetical protein